jgi:hypothetical protein
MTVIRVRRRVGWKFHLLEDPFLFFHKSREGRFRTNPDPQCAAMNVTSCSSQ